MRQMLKDLSRYNAIVFYKIDRLARSTVAFADLMERCQAAKVSMTSVTEPMDLSSPIGRAMAEIIAVFARLERDMIKERSLDARRSLLAEGKFVGGRFPFGVTTATHPSGKGRILVRDKQAVPIIKHMVSKVVDDGYSSTQLAIWLNEKKVQTSRERGATAKKNGAKETYWRGNAVRQVLRNPQLIGHQRLPDGRVRCGDNGMPLEVFPPVLSLSEWGELQAALDKLEGSKRRKRHDSHWLQPFLKCGVCGFNMTNTVTHGRVAFKCARPNELRHRPAPYIRLDELEPWVNSELREKFGTMRVTESVWVGGTDHSAERDQVEATIARLRDDRELGLYDGEEDETRFRSQMKALIARRGVLAQLPDEPGRWEERDTGRTVADDLESGSAADMMDTMGYVVRLWPAGGRSTPTGDRAKVEVEDPAADDMAAVDREEAAWAALA
jgi:DNA invertase Pin-like site-specific DNA recombinase